MRRFAMNESWLDIRLDFIDEFSDAFRMQLPPLALDELFYDSPTLLLFFDVDGCRCLVVNVVWLAVVGIRVLEAARSVADVDAAFDFAIKPDMIASGASLL